MVKKKKKIGANTANGTDPVKPKYVPKPPHPPWQKGQSGNPAGRAPDPPELKMLKNLTKRELVDVGNLVIKGDIEKLKELGRSKTASVITVMLAAVCVRVIEKGDMAALDILLNRLIGKVKDEVIHEGLTQGNPPQIILTLPDNGRGAK